MIHSLRTNCRRCAWKWCIIFKTVGNATELSKASKILVNITYITCSLLLVSWLSDGWRTCWSLEKILSFSRPKQTSCNFCLPMLDLTRMLNVTLGDCMPFFTLRWCSKCFYLLEIILFLFSPTWTSSHSRLNLIHKFIRG